MKICFASLLVFSIVGSTFSASTAYKPNSGICLLIPDTGRCKGTHIRYYFDRATNQCKKFLYGGCAGNENNFLTFEDCEAACGKTVSAHADSSLTPCPYHSCTPEMLNCPTGTGLATDENNCPLCQCEEQPVACPMHSCTKEMLGCSGELAKNENGCDLCECAEPPIACPIHSCTKEMLGCFGKLARNENGCDLCECANVIVEPEEGLDEAELDREFCLLIPDPGPCKGTHIRYYFDRATNRCQKFLYGGCKGNKNNFEKLEECQVACTSKGVDTADLVGPPAACPLHSCTPESLNCAKGTGLVTNENNCELCACKVPGTPVACPTHSCTKENLGCVGELAKDDNSCDLCQCEGVYNKRKRFEEAIKRFLNTQ